MAEPSGRSGGEQGARLVVLSGEQAIQCLTDGVQGFFPAEALNGLAPCDAHRRLSRADSTAEAIDERRLPDARFSRKENRGALGLARAIKLRMQQGEFGVTPDQQRTVA